MQIIYKIMPKIFWEEAQLRGYFRGSSDDLRDGFIHFSTIGQLEQTANKHFKGQTELVLLHVSAETLGNKLKFEISRGGALFPHLYGQLPLSSVLKVTKIGIGIDGKFHVERD